VLSANSGSVVVQSLMKSQSKDNNIIVAGSFSSTGPTTCQAVRAGDTENSQWNALGSSIQGDVAAAHRRWVAWGQMIVSQHRSVAVGEDTMTMV
jgi:hypothetical protein